MLERFKKHSKWRNIIAVERLEVQASLVVALLILGYFLLLDVFGNFALFKDALQTMVGGFLGGFIALLGFALGAVALVASLFGKADILKIETQKPGSIEGMLASFEYLGMVSSATIIVLTLVYITMEVEWPFHVVWFYALAMLVVYLILFTMFYTVSLVGNCVRLYMLRLDETEEDGDGG